jgi:uncharacterized protein with GYD domain
MTLLALSGLSSSYLRELPRMELRQLLRGVMEMPRFVIRFCYSSASWARMLTVADDRTSAVAALFEHLGGKLDEMYWEVEDAAAYVIGELPDSLSAAAAITAATRTGAFKDVQVHQLLTQDQLYDMVTLAKSLERVYRPPGAAAIERDDI